MTGFNTWRSDRGFLQFGEEIVTDHGHRVRLVESSAAFKGPVCYLLVDLEEGNPWGLKPCDAGVHMTLAQATDVRDRLTAFILAAHNGETCEGLDDIPESDD